MENKSEKLIVSLFFLFFFSVMAWTTSINWYNGMGDNATYADITLSIAKNGKPTSQVLSTVIDYIFKEKLVTATPENISALNLNTHHYDQNIFKFHFTPIQYLLAPLAKIVPIHILWESLTAFSYLGMLYLGYFFLRNRSVPIIGTLAILAFISSHPAWNISLFGQIYIDKIFLFTGMLMLFSTGIKKHRFGLIAISAILSSLIIEKTAIVTSIFLIAYSILYWNKKDSLLHLKILCLGIILGLYGFVIIKYYLDNRYYSTFLSVSSITNFANYLSTYPDAYKNLIIFISLNLPLLFLGIFEWRALVIAILMIIPNIFGNLGGAEKVGWITHYHLIYFPFLVWAAISGYANLQKRWTDNKMQFILYAVFILSAIVYGNADQLRDLSAYPFSVSGAFYRLWPITTIKMLRASRNPTGEYQQQKQLEKIIKKTIPENSKVSVPENLMIYLFQISKVYYYPLGFDDADFIVVHLNNDPLLPKYSGVYTHLGQDNNTKIDTWLFNRMKEKGYDIDKPTIYRNVAIIKRIKPTN